MEGVLHHVMCHVTVWKSCDGGGNYIMVSDVIRIECKYMYIHRTPVSIPV